MSLRIIELHASNIKRIKAVTIAPTSNVTRVNGPNASGKTSTLDAILWALSGAGAVDLRPVRTGEERGTISLKIGDTEVRYIVTRTFNAESGTTKLTVASPDGGIYAKPQQQIVDLFGNISLDPQEFQRMSEKERLDTLKRIIRIDVDIDLLDRQNAGDFEQRTAANRDVELLRGRVETYRAGLKPDMVADPIDSSALLRQMQEASEADRIRETEKRRRTDVVRAIESGEREIVDNAIRIGQLEAQIAALHATNRTLEQDNAVRRQEMSAWGPLPNEVDVAHIRQQIEDAERENAHRSLQRTQRANYDAAKAEMDTAIARAEALTQAIEARKRMKSAAIASASFPVPGLSFGEDGVLFNGLPFDQASGAEQLRVSFAIAASMKPKLPVVLIKDGSLMDDRSMAMLEQLATEYDAQVFIERVGYDTVGVVIENGEVVAVDGVPVPPAEPTEPAETVAS